MWGAGPSFKEKLLVDPAEKKRQEEEAARKKAAEEAAVRRAAEEEAARKAAIEDAKRKVGAVMAAGARLSKQQHSMQPMGGSSLQLPAVDQPRRQDLSP